MKMTNDIEHRIEILEIEKEEVEEEIKTTEISIEKLKQVRDNLSPNRETSIELKRFISELENKQMIQEEQRELIDNDIESVRGLIDNGME